MLMVLVEGPMVSVPVPMAEAAEVVPRLPPANEICPLVESSVTPPENVLNPFKVRVFE
jgi:hypothetical protein